MPRIRVGLLAALFAAGCGDGGQSPRGAANTATGPSANISGATLAPPRPTGPAEPAAADFLKAVSGGTVAADRLTPAFLKVIGPPELPADVAKGYDADAAVRWVRDRGAKLTFTPTAKHEAGDAAVFGGTAAGGPKPVRYLLRMVRVGGNWQADWFQTFPGAAPASGGADPFALFAVQAFLDAVLAKDDKLVAALLTPEGKKSVAPPQFKSDEAVGYSRSALAEWVSKTAGGADGYAVSSAGAGAVRAELTGGAKKVLALKLTPGPAPGQFLVSEAKAE